ncbi:hypothetical protein [Parasitella parasitica]|uniref:Protein kinase domain-containing protein n=1 Tax=Parasitella parasitica TaxID=35722 RepID=A0A0B7NH40_9FUNG|nr:hypothetical protein [Parasitella parasitica]
MLSSPRNSVTHNQQAKLAVDYNELLKELSSHEMTSVGCYTIGETIGEGTFGKVKKGTHKLTGRLVAIKKIGKQHAPMMAREIHHHRQLKHPNVVMLYEMITTESCIHIISEFCPNGDLLDALTESGRCSDVRVHKWFRQLTDAVKYCHTRGIVHRDLKLENILLDADDNVKICDFGFARFTQKNQYLETFCGSLSYSAPEVILRKKYTGPETDIWSLGVILYTLLAGEYPFDDDSEIMTQRKIVQVDYEMPFYFSHSLQDLIRNMLQAEPSNRLSIDAIIDHSWMFEEEEDDDTCLTPSSSTATNQSNSSSSDVDSIFSQNDISSVATMEDLDYNYKFSPQVRSSLGMLRPSAQQQQQSKSPRFSAPSLNKRAALPTSPLLQASYRTSLPSSFNYQRESMMSSENLNMTPIEQRLFAALTAAGFDRDALIKMQTGGCDTSSTLWHLLLENMSNSPLPLKSNVSDAFASAMHSRSLMMVDSTSSLDLSTPASSANKTTTSIDRGIQTGMDDSDDEEEEEEAEDNDQEQTFCKEEQPEEVESSQIVKLYPSPIVNQHQPVIQTVGFGSTAALSPNEKSGWFSSVKSWFGSKQQIQVQQQQQQQQQQRQYQQHQQQQQRNRPLSTCSTMSSPIASPSSYRNFDIPTAAINCPASNNDIVCEVMSPPIYRTGSQKYRRRVLQLSDPPVCELDQLTYNATTTQTKPKQSSASLISPTVLSSSSPPPLPRPSSTSTSRITHNNNRLYSNYQPNASSSVNHVYMPPTALTSSSRYVTDTFSILTSASSQPKEIDICEKRYSMMYQRQQLTPPLSPPSLIESMNTSTSTMAVEQTIPNTVVKEMLASPMNSPIEDHSILSLSNASTSTNVQQEIENKHLSDFSSDSCSSSSDSEEEDQDEEEDVIAAEQSILSPQPINIITTTPSKSLSTPPSPNSMFNNMNNRPRPNRFEFVPRSRLSVYGMQDQRGPPMGSKTIIEEEEEE